MMQEAKNMSLELDKLFINSMRDMIKLKAEELKKKSKDEEMVSVIEHIERIAKYTKKLEELEAKATNYTFNGYLSNAEIVIMRIVENVLKDIEKTESEEGIHLSHLKISIYERLSEITSIMEKYLD